MDANGHIKIPDGGVLENYTRQSPFIKEEFNVKSIIKLKSGLIWNSPHGPCNIELYDTNCTPLKGSRFTTLPLYNKIYIRHYITKSWEEFIQKLKRGCNTKKLRTVGRFFDFNPDMLEIREELIKELDPNFKPN